MPHLLHPAHTVSECCLDVHSTPLYETNYSCLVACVTVGKGLLETSKEPPSCASPRKAQ